MPAILMTSLQANENFKTVGLGLFTQRNVLCSRPIWQ